MSLRVAAYAKLNLSLQVLGRRADGFHDIDSLVRTIDLHDRLTIAMTDDGIEVANDLDFDGPDIVAVAAQRILSAKRSIRGVSIRVEKRIPAGAGLGGGSSDAAAVLRAIDSLTPPSLSEEELASLASDVGSDVALFLIGGLMRMSGRGERIEPLPASGPEHYAIVVPPIHCATADVYRGWNGEGHDRRRAAKRGENDLMEPAISLHAGLADVRDAVGELGGVYHGMSGSGSSFFAAFDDAAEAEDAGAALRARLPDSAVFVCSSTDAGSGVLREDT